MGSDDGAAHVGEKIGYGDLEGIINGDVSPPPEHLVILVNGIFGSASDWAFAAERMRSRLGRKFAIHCSGSSHAMKTCDGVDVMGKRLADEIREIIDKTPGVTKISFLAHSLGGLVSRYAIAELYCPPTKSEGFGEGVRDPSVNSKITSEAAQSEFTIGGLQPMTFVTLATPHFGCRGTDQLPSLRGIQALEKTVENFAHWFVGKSGNHLFLTDWYDMELPLLRRMVADCKEGPFISSLAAFKRRVAYANVVNDQAVGWRTSSIRFPWETPDLDLNPVDPKYPHIIREEDTTPLLQDDGRESAQGFPVSLEEEMVVGLLQLAWHRVDVRFRGETGSFQAHNLIQVKNARAHYAGVDVIEHVIDKQFGGNLEHN
ncbi:unnamed protein product [Calypogeia fissa]